MKDCSRNATIAKYTDKSRYKSEYLYGKELKPSSFPEKPRLSSPLR